MGYNEKQINNKYTNYIVEIIMKINPKDNGGLVTTLVLPFDDNKTNYIKYFEKCKRIENGKIHYKTYILSSSPFNKRLCLFKFFWWNIGWLTKIVGAYFSLGMQIFITRLRLSTDWRTSIYTKYIVFCKVLNIYFIETTFWR